MSAESYKSTCCYCGTGCGIIVNKDHKGKVTVEGDKTHPTNKGMLCSKGMNLHYTVQDKTDRLLYPMMRSAKHLPHEKVSWDKALNRAAAVFTSLIKRFGPDSVGFYVSGQLLTEEYYIVNKLTKGFLQTNNIDTNSRLCMSSAVVGYKKALGEDSVPVSYEDIELADCFFITGANPAWCHPIIFRRIEAHKEANPDVKIVVADPRKTQTCALADLHLQLKPGTDITLYHAIAREIIENGWVDENFILDHTDGYQAFVEKVSQKTVEEAAVICEVPANDIRLAAKYIGEANGFISMWAMGLNQSVIGVNKNSALLNLSLITGQIGKPGSGPFSLTGQPNAMGGREVGGLANMLAVHKEYTNPEHRKQVADYWGVPSVPQTPGMSATEMFEALESGKMKAIWVICTNPSVSLPDARLVDKALEKANFVVVQDISNRSDTSKYADLLLPAAGWLEKDGTMTNSDRRINYLSKVIDAPGEALPDAEILWRFASKMGFKESFDYNSYADIYKEHAGLTKGTNLDVSGLDHMRLRSGGSFQWPVPNKLHSGTERLFEDKQFFTPNKKAQIITVADDINQSEPTNPDFPLILTTGRIRDQWHTMTKTGKVNKLKQHIEKPFLEIHPEDAKERGIENGQNVEVKSKRGEVQVTAKITSDIKKGVVFLPMHWGKMLNRDTGRANNVTNNLVDPVSKEPDFKFSAVQVMKPVKQKEKIVIIGAGAAAFRFVNTYRELNVEDEIKVFSKEKNLFYNRVLLPEYISGHHGWDKLLKFNDGEESGLNLKLYDGNGIVNINREQKTVTDEKGEIHSYDKLLIATGSRARRPNNIPEGMEGILTLRNREDADKLTSMLKPTSKVVVVGGGLLGLELAAALSDIGIYPNIIQRTPRLMERQLDEIGSALLHEDVSEKGIEVYYNDEVIRHVGKDKVEGIMLNSGKYLECDILVYSIGTIPNIEFVRESGIECNRGVEVNEYLQTSDPDVFAVGEVAEFKGMLYGITAAAEEQAEIVARMISGHGADMYQGSVLMNILKFADLSLCSLGIAEAPEGDDSYEEVLYIDKARRYYKKCIVKEDKLVGAILIGDKSEFAEFRELIKNSMELADKRGSLIVTGSGEVKQVKGELVCSCNSVGKGNIEEEIQAGCSDFKELCKRTAAGTGCGSCKPEVKTILESMLELV